jgi:hypothetical protein
MVDRQQEAFSVALFFFRSQIISATVVEWRAIGPFKRLAKRHASTSCLGANQRISHQEDGHQDN